MPLAQFSNAINEECSATIYLRLDAFWHPFRVQIYFHRSGGLCEALRPPATFLHPSGVISPRVTECLWHLALDTKSQAHLSATEFTFRSSGAWDFFEFYGGYYKHFATPWLQAISPQ